MTTATVNFRSSHGLGPVRRLSFSSAFAIATSKEVEMHEHGLLDFACARRFADFVVDLVRLVCVEVDMNDDRNSSWTLEGVYKERQVKWIRRGRL